MVDDNLAGQLSRGTGMAAGKFSFEIDGNGELTWTVPLKAPGKVTDRQARTLALLKLATALGELAAAVRDASPPKKLSVDGFPC